MRVPKWLRAIVFLVFMVGVAFFVVNIYFPPQLLEAAKEKSDARSIGFAVMFFLWLVASGLNKGIVLFFGRRSKVLAMASLASFLMLIVFARAIPQVTLSLVEFRWHHNLVNFLFLFGWLSVDFAICLLPKLKSFWASFFPVTATPPR